MEIFYFMKHNMLLRYIKTEISEGRFGGGNRLFYEEKHVFMGLKKGGIRGLVGGENCLLSDAKHLIMGYKKTGSGTRDASFLHCVAHFKLAGDNNYT